MHWRSREAEVQSCYQGKSGRPVLPEGPTLNRTDLHSVTLVSLNVAVPFLSWHLGKGSHGLDIIISALSKPSHLRWIKHWTGFEELWEGMPFHHSLQLCRTFGKGLLREAKPRSQMVAEEGLDVSRWPRSQWCALQWRGHELLPCVLFPLGVLLDIGKP